MKLTFTGKKPEAPDVMSFLFQPAEAVSWQAGQFFHYVLHHEPTDNRGSDRWFTISAAPFEQVVMLTTRLADEYSSTFKKTLKKLKIGDSIEVSDLDGDFVMGDSEHAYVFIAGGIGITPFRAILKQLDHEGKPINVMLLYASRDQNIVFKEELDDIATRNPHFQIHHIIAPDRIGEDKIKELIPDISKPIWYVSGPEPMVDAMGKTLHAMGVAEGSLKQDWFPGYEDEPL